MSLTYAAFTSMKRAVTLPIAKSVAFVNIFLGLLTSDKTYLPLDRQFQPVVSTGLT